MRRRRDDPRWDMDEKCNKKDKNPFYLISSDLTCTNGIISGKLFWPTHFSILCSLLYFIYSIYLCLQFFP
jgi:hypothetical protein